MIEHNQTLQALSPADRDSVMFRMFLAFDLEGARTAADAVHEALWSFLAASKSLAVRKRHRDSLRRWGQTLHDHPEEALALAEALLQEVGE